MKRILLVEDDKTITETLRTFLGSEGFAVDVAPDQGTALARLETDGFDLLLLDVSLPDGSGFAVCRAARELGDTPIIFLTASGDEFSVVGGLQAGADDYITKPFRPRELVARIQSVLRRHHRADPILRCGPLQADPAKGIVWKNGQELALSALEYRLLLVFLQNPGVLLSRSRLLEELWDTAGDYVNDNTLTVYVKRLREKLGDDPQNPTLIRTVRALGYRMGDGT